MAAAAMGSSLMRNRIIATLIHPVSSCCVQHAPDSHTSPFLRYIVQSLPLAATSHPMPGQQSVTSTLSLLLNASHNCPAIGQVFGKVELGHMVVMLNTALAELERINSTKSGCTEAAASHASGILCILINVVEHCSDSAVTLAGLGVGSQACGGIHQLSTELPDRHQIVHPPAHAAYTGGPRVGPTGDTRNRAVKSAGKTADRGVQSLCTCGKAQLRFVKTGRPSSSPKHSPAAKKRAFGSRRRPALKPLSGQMLSTAPKPRRSAPAASCNRGLPQATAETVCLLICIIW